MAGRPFQAGMQLGSATLIDPATNLARFSLPAIGIDTVSVLPNPYEVEFGAVFGSGLVVIQTRRATDKWRFGVSNLEPALRLKRFTLLNVTGVTLWQPDLGGRGSTRQGQGLSLSRRRSITIRRSTSRAVPKTNSKHNEWVQLWFTRIDANLSKRHSLAVSGGFIPSATRQETLGTFVPPDATVNLKADDKSRMGC